MLFLAMLTVFLKKFVFIELRDVNLQARGVLGTNVTDCSGRLVHFLGAAAQLATKAEKWGEKVFC